MGSFNSNAPKPSNLGGALNPVKNTTVGIGMQQPQLFGNSSMVKPVQPISKPPMSAPAPANNNLSSFGQPATNPATSPQGLLMTPPIMAPRGTPGVTNLPGAMPNQNDPSSVRNILQNLLNNPSAQPVNNLAGSPTVMGVLAGGALPGKGPNFPYSPEENPQGYGNPNTNNIPFEKGPGMFPPGYIPPA